MHATVIRMISSHSLSAFSAATTTAPINRTGPVRLVRDQAAARAERSLQKIPQEVPKGALPRGSLLDISV